MEHSIAPFDADIPVETERHSCRDELYLEKLAKHNADCGWTLVGTESKPPPGTMAVFQRPVPSLDDAFLQILESGLDSGVISSADEERVRFLKRCGFVSNEMCLTKSGWLHFLEAASLSFQCELLGLELETVPLARSRRVETDALKHYQEAGYQGCHAEGGILLLLLKALCLGWLREVRPSWDTRGCLPKEELRENASRNYFEAQLNDNLDKRDCFVSEVNSCNQESLITNFQEIYSYPDVRKAFPGLTEQLILGAYAALGVEKLVQILDLLMVNPYRFRKGWPDLTLFRDGEIRLVEVKNQDRLHLSQLVTIPAVQRAVGLPIAVLRVERMEKARAVSPDLPF